MKGKNIKIFVTHFHNPHCIYSDDIFIPIQAGKKNSKIDLGIKGDDTGDNISGKNPQYAELTTQYRVWKNYDLSDVEYVGFCHYRRYLTFNYRPNILKFWRNIQKNESIYSNIYKSLLYILGLLYNVSFQKDIIKKCSHETNVFLNNHNYDIYLSKNTLNYKTPLYKMGLTEEKLRNIFDNMIHTKYPGYIKTLKKVMNLKSTNLGNIFIMKIELFYEYSEWLFDILFDFEKEIKERKLENICLNEKMTAGTRFLGCFGERLLNLWIKYKESEGFKISNNANMIYFRDLKN